MAKVYLTDEHYFLCSGGLFPARIYDGKSTHVSKTGKRYLTHYDTATKTPDFTCRWAVVLAVMAAVFFALLASNPIGWAILAGLIIGLGTGFLMCGVMMASGRKWIGYEQHLIIKRTQYALTSDSYMVCPLGGKISWSPEITSPGIALWTGLRNTGFATFQGIMYGYAAYGGVSLFTTSGWEAVLPNLIKGWAKTYGKAGLLVRSGFAAENVAYRNATRQYEGGEPTDMLKDAGKTFVGDIYQYYNIGTKLANGEKVGAEEFANGVATPLGMVGLNIQLKNADYQIPYALRRISNRGYIGGSKLLFKRDIVAERMDYVREFYEKVFKERVVTGKMTREKAIKAMNNELKGIDYRMPIKVRYIRGEMYQYQKHGLDGTYYEGEYYTPDATAKPTDLGVSSEYNVRDSNMNPTGKTDKIRQIQVNKEGCIGLESTSSPINDDWSVYQVDTNGNVVIGTNGKPVPVEVPTKGKGTQIYIPRNQGCLNGIEPSSPHPVYPIYPDE